MLNGVFDDSLWSMSDFFKASGDCISDPIDAIDGPVHGIWTQNGKIPPACLKSVVTLSACRTCGFGPRQALRTGLTLIELLVAIAVVGILVALLLPAVSSAREAARKTQCANQLRQIGIGLHGYHDLLATFPSGYVADVDSGSDGKSWGWGALLLPFVEERTLSDQLTVTKRSFDEVASDYRRARFLRTNVSLYRCPSDPGDGLSHRFRSIIVPLAVARPPFAGTGVAAQLQQIGPLAHIYIPPSAEEVPLATRIAKSNYVGSLGNRWKPERRSWRNTDFEGNGLFGRNSKVSISKVLDGTSKTLAVGERSMRNYAAVWAGGNSWQGCGFGDNQMVLGTAFYPINDAPIGENIDCDGRGSANFSSYHYGGANFLYADGSVHFLPQQVDHGVFQNLAQRDDGDNVGDF